MPEIINALFGRSNDDPRENAPAYSYGTPPTTTVAEEPTATDTQLTDTEPTDTDSTDTVAAVETEDATDQSDAEDTDAEDGADDSAESADAGDADDSEDSADVSDADDAEALDADAEDAEDAEADTDTDAEADADATADDAAGEDVADEGTVDGDLADAVASEDTDEDGASAAEDEPVDDATPLPDAAPLPEGAPVAEAAPVTEADEPAEAVADEDGEPAPVVELVTAEARPAAGTRGSISVGDGVVAKVVDIAVGKVDGVHSLAEDGISTDVDGDVATITIALVVEYGHPIKALAEQLRTEVIDAVEQFLGLEVAAVDVHVSDINPPSA